MSAIYEAYRSPSMDVVDKGEGGGAVVSYHILDVEDKATASALARAYAPLTFETATELLIRQKMKLDPTGLDTWEAVFTYGSENEEKSKEPPKPGTWKFTFDTTGGKHKVTVAPMISRHWWTAHDEAPDLYGAINFDGKDVKGVERIVPQLKFSITAYYSPDVVTPRFAREVARKTARTNSDKWLGFEPKELLYFGGTGEGDSPTIAGQRVSPIPIKHHLEASENRTNIPVEGITLGDPQAAINKKGWEYMWVRFMKTDDTSQVVMRPRHVYVNEIYPDTMSFADFFGFGGE